MVDLKPDIEQRDWHRVSRLIAKNKGNLDDAFFNALQTELKAYYKSKGEPLHDLIRPFPKTKSDLPIKNDPKNGDGFYDQEVDAVSGLARTADSPLTEICNNSIDRFFKSDLHRLAGLHELAHRSSKNDASDAAKYYNQAYLDYQSGLKPNQDAIWAIPNAEALKTINEQDLTANYKNGLFQSIFSLHIEEKIADASAKIFILANYGNNNGEPSKTKTNDFFKALEDFRTMTGGYDPKHYTTPALQEASKLFEKGGPLHGIKHISFDTAVNEAVKMVANNSTENIKDFARSAHIINNSAYEGATEFFDKTQAAESRFCSTTRPRTSEEINKITGGHSIEVNTNKLGEELGFKKAFSKAQLSVQKDGSEINLRLDSAQISNSNERDGAYLNLKDGKWSGFKMTTDKNNAITSKDYNEAEAEKIGKNLMREVEFTDQPAPLKKAPQPTTASPAR